MSTSFPLLQYTSLVGTKALLLIFTALYLPRSSSWFGIRLDSQKSSLDRPQLPFLVPLTANPTATGLWISLGCALIIMWWAGWTRLWWSLEKKTAISDSSTRVRAKLYAIRNAWVFTLVGSLIYYIVLLAFGAPVSYFSTTASFALLLSILTVYAPAYTLPIPYFELFGFRSTENQPMNAASASTAGLLDRLTWTRLFSQVQPTTLVERAIVYPVMGTLVGSWVGAIPLALDWDRPWQAWPLIPVYGAIVGHVVGSGCAVARATLEALAQEGLREEVSSHQALGKPVKAKRPKDKRVKKA
ncbi:hypothetical protein BS47DRAFT_1341364 [Hydnum rufescens UP504]|uniref:Uncharacterized protein n=1 Tax=Hydnum rufescens UP504 TaxID=1448309 RepID=A0A9P6DYJ9_9AGAM|nr:hypothetical protein BS47DRAFT_1341364 [Hydnum rufescens UP504]